jgi:hypothetical protein
VVLSTVAVLIALDAILGFAFGPPANPRQRLSALQTYFNYGRSIDGKLRDMIAANPADDAAIVKAGWIGRECDVDSTVPPGKLAIDIYGNSFSNNVSYQMERLDAYLVFQRFAGPAAPVSHSYACFMRRYQALRVLAPVQIIGVLASSLPQLLTLSGLTTSFEMPEPFTYPRYRLTSDQRLVATWPSIRSQADLHKAFADPGKWRGFLDELAVHDAFYNEILFRGGLFDHSVVARLLRRAWAQRLIRMRTDALEAANKFAGAPDIPAVLRAMLFDFAMRSRAIGARPIVILIEDGGYGGVFTPFIVSALRAAKIDFILTSTIASPTDSQNFIGGGHFTPEIDAKIARAVLELLRHKN